MTPDTELLSRLRDIHPPLEPPWWPPAPGSVVVVCAVFLLCYLIVKHAPRRLEIWKRRRVIGRRFEQVIESYAKNGDGRWLCAELSKLLRTVAIERFPDEAVAGLHGKGWLMFLKAHSRDPDMLDSCAELIIQGPYRKHAQEFDAAALVEACRTWIGEVHR